MTPKRRRMLWVAACIVMMAGAATGILNSFQQQLIYFYTPTQLHEALANVSTPFDRSRNIRVGGLVKTESLYHKQDGSIGFIITDLTHEIQATYHGMIPALFREGQGVVAEGKFTAIGVLEATTILAKHDENYMPKSVVDELKKSGKWQEGTSTPQASPTP